MVDAELFSHFWVVLKSFLNVHLDFFLSLFLTEHRNMPFEDAMSLISRNFQIFLRERQERLAKANAAPPVAAAAPAPPPPPPPAGAPPELVIPDKYTRYLLNLVIDDRILTVQELDKLLDYLEDRRYRYIQLHGGPPRQSEYILVFVELH